MEINRNSLLGIAKAVAFPIPTAIEAIVDAFTDEPKPAAPPPPPPPPILPDAVATPADAHAKANALWNNGKDGKDVLTRPMVAALEEKAANWEKAAQNDPAKAEQARLYREQATAARKELDAGDTEAVRQHAANRKLEQAALKDLSPDDQQKYHALQKALDNDPQGQLALQLLLIDGKCKPGPATANKDGKGLLDALTGMKEAKLAPPLENGDLMAQACREMANPASIKQKGLNTCSAAAVQIMVATEKPAEYVRILTGLAADEAEDIPLTGLNKTVKRNEMSEWDDNSGRTQTSRLWQSAFMEMGAKALDPNATYDHTTDTITWSNKPATTDGIEGIGAGVMAGAAMGGKWSYVDQGDVMDRLIGGAIDDLKKKPPVKAKLELGTTYDAAGNPTATQTVTLEAFTPAKKDRNGKVIAPATYTVKDDATGKVQKLTGQELGPRLQAIPSKGFDREKVTDFMLKQVLDDVGKGQSCVVMLRWGDFQGAVPKDGGGQAFNHFVNVTKVEGDTVTFLNSHGKEQTMPLAEFKNKLANVTVNDQLVAP